MLQKLYDTVISLAERPSAMLWLFGIAFAEASFFPIPPDAMLIPMALAQPRRAWWLAAITTAGSVVGGALGYAIGFYLLDRLAQPIIHFYHYEGAFTAFQAKFARYGVWVILIKGLTPIPYKIVTIAAGAAQISRRSLGTPVFAGMIAASLIGIFVIPLLYAVFQTWREKVSRKTPVRVKVHSGD